MSIRQNNYNDMSDAEIWTHFKSGSEEAFQYIYERYFDRLFNYGSQFTRDTGIIEDALQELFLDLRRRREYLSDTDAILPYLYASFRRKIIRYRDRRMKHQVLEEEYTFVIEPNIEDDLISEDEQREQNRKLKLGLKALSEKHREIIFLFYYENFTYEEIKAIQQFEDVKSARNLLYKALKSLRSIIKYIPMFSIL